MDSAAAESIPAPRDEQTRATELSDLTRALYNLPPEQREALILVGVGGFSYEETAEIIGCVVGTVKSRVARARGALTTNLDSKHILVGGQRMTSGDAFRKIMTDLVRLSPPATPDSPARDAGPSI